METKNIPNLKIYDWKKTVEDKTNREARLLKNFPYKFYKIEERDTLSGKIDGNWAYWELTDEGSGQYPIFKCFIADGTFKLNINNKNIEYDLKNKWIKVCVKIENDGEDRYSLSNRDGNLYIINHSFSFDKESKILESFLEKMFLKWLKDNLNLLTNHVNEHKIHYSTSNDLTLAGWDTNYVTSFTNVNKTIEKKALYPKEFHNEINNEFLGNYVLNGNFESWQMTTGADGQNVNFICKIGSDSLITNNNNGSQYQAQDDAYVNIQVKLEYFNSDTKTFEDPTGLGDGHQVDLKVKTDNDANDNPPVIITKCIFNESYGPSLNDYIVEPLLKEWFNENIDKFENIFSYFLLKETAKDENFQWLKPTTSYYGVASVEDEEGNPDLDKSVFSVMTMVEDHKNEYPQHTVDARLLSAVNNESAFGIDMPLFVEKWLKRALLLMELGPEDNFETSSNGLVFTNKEKMNFGKIIRDENDDDGPYSYIDSGKFKMGIINDQVSLEIEDLHWEQASGIIGHVFYKQSFDISLDSGIDESGKEYKNVLIPIENSDPTLLMTYTIEDWKREQDLIIEIVAGIAIGIVIGFIPYAGSFFSKIKGLIAAAVEEESGNVVINIGKAILNAIKEAASDFANEIKEAYEALVNKFATRVRYAWTMPGEWEGVPAEEVAGILASELEGQKLTLLERLWQHKFKIVGGIIATSAAVMSPTIIINCIENAAQKTYSELPTIDNFVTNCVGAINWPDNSEFEVESAKLQGIYLMGGKLNK